MFCLSMWTRECVYSQVSKFSTACLTLRSKKYLSSVLLVLYEGNPTMTDRFPFQMASNLGKCLYVITSSPATAVQGEGISIYTLQWRHNGRDSVSNHQPHDCLLNRLFRRRSKKTFKLRVTGLCTGKSPVTCEFPAQMASNAESASI